MTVRDWLQLLIVPFALVVIGFLFTMQQDARQQKIEDRRAQQAQKIEDQRAEAERELAEQRAQDEALQAYLDQMSGLLLEKDLRASEEESEVRTLARARTLTVLRRLDPTRKAAVIQFLSEAQLVQTVEGRGPIIRLSGADLSDATLSDANLSGANLGDTKLSDATLSGTKLSDADLSDANLSDADLSGADVSGATLFNANLSGATLSGASLTNADLSNADLINANLSIADRRGGLEPVPQAAADLSEADLSEADLSEADLSGATLDRADLINADLSEADLINANLINADLINADLSGASLIAAALFKADLSDADLSGADLINANLINADLSGANLSGADLSGANPTNADLSDADGVTKEGLEQQAESLEGTIMPDGTIYPGRYAARAFEPALSFSVSDGWRLAYRETDVLFIRGPEEVDLLFTNPLHVFDPKYPSEAKELPAPENADEWASWFQSHPNLDTSKPLTVSVGGASGLQIDVKATSTRENYARDLCGEQPCVPLYSISDGSAIPSFEGFKDRFIIVDVGGETVIIDVKAPTDYFDELLPKAQKVLDTVEWKGG